MGRKGHRFPSHVRDLVEWACHMTPAKEEALVTFMAALRRVETAQRASRTPRKRRRH